MRMLHLRQLFPYYVYKIPLFSTESAASIAFQIDFKSLYSAARFKFRKYGPTPALTLPTSPAILTPNPAESTHKQPLSFCTKPIIIIIV